MTLKLTKVSFFPKGSLIWSDASIAIREYRLQAVVREDLLDANGNPSLEWNYPPVQESGAYSGTGNYAFDKMLGSRPVIGYKVPEVWQDEFGFHYSRLVQSPPSVPVAITSDRSPQYLEVINSSNTDGWPRSQGPRRPGVALTKSAPSLIRPKKPVFPKDPPRPKAPKEPVFEPLRVSPPSQFAGEGIEEYNVRRGKWERQHAKRAKALFDYRRAKYAQQMAKYEERLLTYRLRVSYLAGLRTKGLAKYEKRLANYNKRLLASQTPTFRREGAGPHHALPDNYYGRIRMSLQSPVVASSGSLVSWNDAVDLFGVNYLNSGWGSGYPYSASNPPFMFYHWQSSSRALSIDHHRSEITQYAEDVRQRVISLLEPHVSAYDKKLRRKLHSKLKSQDVHIGNMLAERKQTFDLVTSTLKRVLSLVKAKKTILKAVASYIKTPKAIANDVLAFKFGVEPLMADVAGLIKVIDEMGDEPVATARVNLGGGKPKGLRKEDYQKPGGIPLVVSDGPLQFEGFVEMSYVVKCTVSNTAAKNLSQLGLINPLEIAWEVLPWSFVIDWFVPVGDWLSSQTADCGLEFLTGTRTVRYTGRFTDRSSNQGFSSSHDGSSQPLVFEGQVMERRVLTELPDVPLPSIKNPWSWSHGVESVALAVQQMRR